MDSRPQIVHTADGDSISVDEFGLRLLSYDRPGYGSRPRRRDRRVADSIDDVRRIADALRIERFGVWGFSGGGCYAMASAALLPDLVTGAAVFAGFAPYGASGLDFTEGMSPEYASEVELFFTDRPIARQHWRQDADQFLGTLGAPEGWMARWGDTAGTDDARSWDVTSPRAYTIRRAAVTVAGGTTGSLS